MLVRLSGALRISTVKNPSTKLASCVLDVIDPSTALGSCSVTVASASLKASAISTIALIPPSDSPVEALIGSEVVTFT